MTSEHDGCGCGCHHENDARNDTKKDTPKEVVAAHEEHGACCGTSKPTSAR